MTRYATVLHMGANSDVTDDLGWDWADVAVLVELNRCPDDGIVYLDAGYDPAPKEAEHDE